MTSSTTPNLFSSFVYYIYSVFSFKKSETPSILVYLISSKSDFFCINNYSFSTLI